MNAYRAVKSEFVSSTPDVFRNRDAAIATILEDDAAIAIQEQASDPLVKRAASELIRMDDDGIATRIEERGRPYDVLTALSEKLLSAGGSRTAITKLFEPLQNYITAQGADLTKRFNARELWALVVVASEEPETPECSFVSTTKINGERIQGDDASKVVMQYTAYGTRMSMSRERNLQSASESTKQKDLYVMWGFTDTKDLNSFDGSSGAELTTLVEALGPAAASSAAAQEIRTAIETGTLPPAMSELIQTIATLNSVVDAARTPGAVENPAAQIAALKADTIALVQKVELGEAVLPVLAQAVLNSMDKIEATAPAISAPEKLAASTATLVSDNDNHAAAPVAAVTESVISKAATVDAPAAEKGPVVEAATIDTPKAEAIKITDVTAVNVTGDKAAPAVAENTAANVVTAKAETPVVVTDKMAADAPKAETAKIADGATPSVAADKTTPVVAAKAETPVAATEKNSVESPKTETAKIVEAYAASVVADKIAVAAKVEAPAVVTADKVLLETAKGDAPKTTEVALIAASDKVSNTVTAKVETPVVAPVSDKVTIETPKAEVVAKVLETASSPVTADKSAAVATVAKSEITTVSQDKASIETVKAAPPKITELAPPTIANDKGTTVSAKAETPPTLPVDRSSVASNTIPKIEKTAVSENRAPVERQPNPVMNTSVSEPAKIQTTAGNPSTTKANVTEVTVAQTNPTATANNRAPSVTPTTPSGGAEPTRLTNPQPVTTAPRPVRVEITAREQPKYIQSNISVAAPQTSENTLPQFVLREGGMDALKALPKTPEFTEIVTSFSRGQEVAHSKIENAIKNLSPEEQKRVIVAINEAATTKAIPNVLPKNEFFDPKSNSSVIPFEKKVTPDTGGDGQKKALPKTTDEFNTCCDIKCKKGESCRKKFNQAAVGTKSAMETAQSIKLKGMVFNIS